MSTLHHWFRSGDHSLLAHLDLPESIHGDCALLMVPPFGWEDVCSYRPLRFLSRMFASHGIPAMRFDLPGTGDSSGDARDPDLFDAWVSSVGDAAKELRASAGVTKVAVMGVRMGAMVALAAANRGANIQDLILWSPAASGRAVVRELYAFSKLARAEYSNGAPSPPPPLAGLEAGGFLLTPEIQRALDSLDLSMLTALSTRRILLLSRDHFPPEEKLAIALRASGCTVEIQNGEGYAAMMAIPEEAVSPTTSGRTIIEFLLGTPHTANDRFASRSPAISTAIETGHGPTVEDIYQVENRGESLFGILSRPRPPRANPDWCILFLNPGAVRHIGPNRMWVEAARRLAARGVNSLRLDLQGIGESEGPVNRDVASLYQNGLVEQVEAAMASLRANTGARRFAVVGLCSGAFWAFHAAIRNPEIRAAILLNPRLFFWDPEVDPRRVLRRTARLMTESTDWRRLLRGYVSVDTFKRVSRTVFERVRTSRPPARPRTQIWPEGMADAWLSLGRNQTRMTMIFTEGEPLLREMEEEGHLPPPFGSRVRCIRLANCGHTFRPLWAQQSAHELIDRELDAIFKEAGIVESSQDMEYLST